MKRLSIVILLMFVAFSSNAQSKIGTIDAEYILAQLPESSEVTKNLEAYNAELQAELESNIKKYEDLVKDYQETVETMNDTVKKEKEDAIIELENNIKNFRQKASVMIQVKRNELNGPLYEKIDAAMKKVISEGGYTQIFHSGASGLAFSRAEDDITQKVMNVLGVEAKPAAGETTNN
ncbi:OmpH family outer membrane protein [Christiangramia sabulilitoris]|uniref:OmpH family outer membrane protein n=1 Tax=Christiangramia sabulilitoris TaxID=2583991 RepID=A0A550I383_9FLAO|nr:OmpH family outer membrane protein [Christiangramia sabulilitoris]TRO65444.1 OmpH family outer membrane protein [Christiangramia sabulilitoris]